LIILKASVEKYFIWSKKANNVEDDDTFTGKNGLATLDGGTCNL
jgi:hypothetical protein